MIPIVRALKDKADLDSLVQAAGLDGHVAIAPTHVAERDGQIVGYASIGAAPLVNVWLHSQKAGPRDSLYLLNLVECVARERLMASGNHRAVFMPCAEESPFYQHMQALGYRVLGKSVLHVKELR